MKHKYNWLAVVVGNSRLHWAWFKNLAFVETWDTHHLTIAVKPNFVPPLLLHKELIRQNLSSLPVYLASVVANQTKYWQNYFALSLITLKDIKLTNVYPTMGVDRALAVCGAIAVYQQACLVIDGGTALTFTGVDAGGKLVGGAILPGLRSQLLSLRQKTSALPEVKLPDSLPPRWALDTDTAIASGVLHTAISGIRGYIDDWLQQFPHSQIVFTGGDGQILWRFLVQQFPELSEQTAVDPNLVFEGVKLIYQQKNKE
ncbi:MAG: pantothenate kinase [Cyanobacteria bacterium J06600_6]